MGFVKILAGLFEIKSKVPRGFAMMIVLMFLLLLYTLGVAFLMVTIIQWEVAMAWLDDVRARETAESGVPEAINNLYLTFPMQVSKPESPCVWRYWGNNIDEIGEPDDALIEVAKNPSFALEGDGDPYDDKPQPLSINVNMYGHNRQIGISGISPKGIGRYGLNSEVFSLKVTDTSSQLYINEGLGHPYNTAVMRRMLNTLGTYLNQQGEEWAVVPANLGDIIITNRPPEGYKAKQELLQYLSWKAYMKIKHYLCANTWVDTKVCNPVPLSNAAIGAYDPELFATRPTYSGNPITRYLEGLNFGSEISGYDSLNPCYIETTSRAPVNINTASKAVLVSCLSYLEGFFIQEQMRCYGWSYFYSGYSGNLGKIYRTYPIDLTKAGEIAEQVIQRRARKPFSSWQDFNRFIDNLVGSVIVDPRPVNTFYGSIPPWTNYNCPMQAMYASQAMADSIKANANPNLHLNEINPDAQIWQFVDKTDLIKNSTEFCFIPTGVFEIESLGMVLRPQPKEGQQPDSLAVDMQNLLRGKRKIITEVKLYDIYRETTQRDFYRGDLKPLDPFFSKYYTSNMSTTKTGPEPDNGLAPYENNYEGYVMLSNVGGTGVTNKKKGQVWQTTTNASCQMNYGSTMHGHYDFDFRLHDSVSAGVYSYLYQKKNGCQEESIVIM